MNNRLTRTGGTDLSNTIQIMPWATPLPRPQFQLNWAERRSASALLPLASVEWTQSTKLKADSMGHDEIAGASLLSGLNSGLQRWPQRSWAQREGMCLIEYLRDVAHDGVLSRVHLVTDQPQTGASGVVRRGRRHGQHV
jgi:hypothetical protein